VGTSGLSKVQVWIHSEASDWPHDDKYFATAPWIDASIQPPPPQWGELPEGRIPLPTRGALIREVSLAPGPCAFQKSIGLQFYLD
jgi:hypothetical protein